jgi:hypothetical protein
VSNHPKDTAYVPSQDTKRSASLAAAKTIAIRLDRQLKARDHLPIPREDVEMMVRFLLDA